VHIFVKNGSINLHQIKTKMMVSGTYYTSSNTFYQRKCFVFVIFVLSVCLFVCHIPHIPFVHSISEGGKSLYF